MNLSTRIVFGMAVISLALGSWLTAGADTVYVPGDYATIQLGIWAVGPGDTVLVGPGSFNENLVMASGVTVLGAAGAGSTTINGSGSAPVARFEGISDAVLEGFTLVNGMGASRGGGVRAVSATGCRLTSVIVRGNFAFSDGGGIALDASTFTIEDSEVRENVSFSSGPGIALVNGASAEIRRNWIEQNYVLAEDSKGGGIYLAAGTSAVIEYNVIVFNFATATSGAGGGIYCAAADALISHNTIVDNGFTIIGGPERLVGDGPGAGLYLANSSALVTSNIIGTVFPGDDWAGSAVYCANGLPTFEYNDVWNNPLNNPDPAYEGTCADQTGLNGNISADPEFCDPGFMDYTLCASSPCAGTGAGGSNMGALDIGCSPTATQPATWGALKHIFE